MNRVLLCILVIYTAIQGVLAIAISNPAQNGVVDPSRWYVDTAQENTVKANKVMPQAFADREDLKHHAYEEDESLVKIPFDTHWLKFSYWKDKYRPKKDPHKQGSSSIDQDAYAY